MAWRTWVLAIVVAVAACKEPPDSQTPRELLDICTPGRSLWQCHQALSNLPPKMFPADRLEGIDVKVENVDRGNGPVPGSFDGVLVYTLKFNVGRDFVMELLEAELGQPLGHGSPRTQTLLVHVGDYWQTEEGYWICFDRGVAWYSSPIASKPGHVLVWPPVQATDGSVPHVPKSAALWTKIGRLLIGSDAKPRLRNPPPRSGY